VRQFQVATTIERVTRVIAGSNLPPPEGCTFRTNRNPICFIRDDPIVGLEVAAVDRHRPAGKLDRSRQRNRQVVGGASTQDVPDKPQFQPHPSAPPSVRRSVRQATGSVLRQTLFHGSRGVRHHCERIGWNPSAIASYCTGTNLFWSGRCAGRARCRTLAASIT
jgi:hypothetical protein